MTHPVERLGLFVAGELPPSEMSSITAHLAACAACAQAVDQLAAVEGRLRRLEFAPPAHWPVVRKSRAGLLALVAAAGVVLGVAGGMWIQAGRQAQQVAASDSRPLFMLTFHERVSERLALGPADRDERGRRMMAWVGTLRQSGVFVSGEKLRDEAGRMVSTAGVDDQVGHVPDGELVSGYFIIAAADYDEATRLARASPIVAVGGRVEVRALQ